MKKILLFLTFTLSISTFAEVSVKQIDSLTEAGRIDALITLTGDEAQAVFNSAGQAEGYQFVTSTADGVTRRSTVTGAEVVCTEKSNSEESVKCVVNILD
jgi:hypothetical protein